MTAHIKTWQERAAIDNTVCFSGDAAVPYMRQEIAELRAAIDALATVNDSLKVDPDPIAWAVFDGEGNYDFLAYDGNESYLDDYLKRNGIKYKGWVQPLGRIVPVAETGGKCAECSRKSSDGWALYCVDCLAAFFRHDPTGDQDAARYRWIRDTANNGYHLRGPSGIGKFEVKQKVKDGEGMYYFGESLDAAIDTAMQAEVKK